MQETNQNQEENKGKKPNKSYAYESARVMSVAFELGFLIALPIVAFALLGKWLDHKQGTGFYVYLGIILAIFVSSITVYRRFAALVDKLREAAGVKNDPKTQKENK